LALLALAFFVALVVRLRLAHALGLRRLAVSAATVLLPLVGSALSAVLLWLLAQLLHPSLAEYVLGDPYEPGWLRAGFVTLAIAASAGWYRWLRRRLGGLTLWVGALAWLVLLGLVVTLAAPGAGYLLVLPALVWSAAALVLTLVDRPQWWPAVMLLGAVVAVLV